MSTAASPILSAESLSKRFSVRHGLFSGDGRAVTAVDNVSFGIAPGEIFGLVGESGSGKSTLARLVLQLVSPDSGTVVFGGVDLASLDRRQMLEARKKIQVIFQDPGSALSPRRTILQTLVEPLDRFAIGEKASRRQRCIDALETVGLDESLLERLPRQLSAGQRQRIAIARAILTEPDLVVADEAVSALDVSLQAQVLELIRRLRSEKGIAFLFITHDLAVIHQVADRVAVMYRGQIVESGPVRSLFEKPAHPYTRELLAAIPDPDPSVPMSPAGVSPGLARVTRQDGCPFADRCPEVTSRCQAPPPNRAPFAGIPEHQVKCHLYD